MRRTVLVTALLLACSCIKPVEENDRPCPCSKDWFCCVGAEICVANESLCPGPDAGSSGQECTANSCPSGQECTPVKRCGISFGSASLPPKVMLALDKSGSMKQHSTDTQWGCCAAATGGVCSGYDPTGDCKWNTLKHLLFDTGGFFDQLQGSGRFGLAVFPNRTAGTTGDACMNGEILVDVGTGNNFAAIQQALDAADMAPLGGTPTSAILRTIASDSSFMAEETNTPRYVVLVTDGMPNCNASLNGATCTCTSSDCSNPLNCLDDAASQDAIRHLHDLGVMTFIVGFGNENGNPLLPTVLDNLAAAGGTTHRYQADSVADLQTILDTLIKVQIKPCIFPLARIPEHPDDLEVVLTDTQGDVNTILKRGTQWDYVTTGADTVGVEIDGGNCTLIQTSSNGRYKLSFLLVTPI